MSTSTTAAAVGTVAGTADGMAVGTVAAGAADAATSRFCRTTGSPATRNTGVAGAMSGFRVRHSASPNGTVPSTGLADRLRTPQTVLPSRSLAGRAGAQESSHRV